MAGSYTLGLIVTLTVVSHLNDNYSTTSLVINLKSPHSFKAEPRTYRIVSAEMFQEERERGRLFRGVHHEE